MSYESWPNETDGYCKRCRELGLTELIPGEPYESSAAVLVPAQEDNK